LSGLHRLAGNGARFFVGGSKVGCTSCGQDLPHSRLFPMAVGLQQCLVAALAVASLSLSVKGLYIPGASAVDFSFGDPVRHGPAVRAWQL